MLRIGAHTLLVSNPKHSTSQEMYPKNYMTEATQIKSRRYDACQKTGREEKLDTFIHSRAVR